MVQSERDCRICGNPIPPEYPRRAPAVDPSPPSPPLATIRGATRRNNSIDRSGARDRNSPYSDWGRLRSMRAACSSCSMPWGRAWPCVRSVLACTHGRTGRSSEGRHHATAGWAELRSEQLGDGGKVGLGGLAQSDWCRSTHGLHGSRWAGAATM